MLPKITLIGAGSVVFAKQLIADVLHAPELSDATICLMDIDPARLKVADVMARRMVAKLKSTVKIEATTNQRKAIQGANYVICTIQVGGYKPGTVIDFDIPKKYGLRQTIADTLGVGGVFRGLRTIPVINKIAQDIAEVGKPGCLLLNYTNPMAMNCMGVFKGVGIPHVGLCHSVQGTSQMLAQMAGVDYKDVTYLVAGVNHMAFFLKLEYRGQDIYPLLFKLAADPDFHSEKVRFEMMRRTGYFVTESSEHQSEYVPYFIHHGEKIVQKFDIPLDEYIRRCDAIIATWKSAEAALIGGGKGDIDIPKQSHEYGSYIIRARESNKPVVIYGNVPNTGLITNLPQGCCVEVPCLIDGQGIQPTVIGDLPPQLAAICRTNINVQELTVEAALTQKREHIYHAVMVDPHTSSQLTLDKIWAMCDDLIEAHQKVGLLGEFSRTIKNTGRGYAGVGDRVLARISSDTGMLPEKWSDLDLAVELENPADYPQEVAVTVSTKNVDFKPQTIRVKLGAGKKVLHKLKFAPKQQPGEKLEIDLLGETPNVLCKGLVFGTRSTITLPAGGESVTPFTLNGFNAGEVRLRREKNGMRVNVNVFDSKVTTAKKNARQSYATSSCIELFFSPINGGGIAQIFCYPKVGDKAPRVHHAGGRPVKGLVAKQTLGKVDYSVDLLIPYDEININPNSKEFLFDLIANLNALGDAHSGGRLALNNNYDSYCKAGHYSLVTTK